MDIKAPCSQAQSKRCLFPALSSRDRGGTVIVDPHSGYILAADVCACEMLGYTEKKLRELHISEIQVGVAFKSQLEWQAFAKAIIQKGKTKTLSNGRIRCKTGNTFPSLTFLTYKIHEGAEIFIAQFNDISDTTWRNDKLFSMQERFRWSFEFAPIPMAIVSNSKLFLQINPAFSTLLGYVEKEVIDQPYDVVIDVENKNTLLTTYCSNPLEAKCRHRNRKIKEINLTTNAVRNDEGELQYYVFQLIDVTEKNKMENQLRLANQQSRAFSKKLLLVQEEERRRIAKELHDRLGQALMAQKLIANNLSYDESCLDKKKLIDLNGLIDECINTVRKVATDLHSSVLDELGLYDAIESEVVKLNRRSTVKFSLSISQQLPDYLSDSIKNACFWIFQEATTNILRHAQATCATISLELSQKQLVMKIQDNGKGGISLEPNKLTSLGILSMKERISSVNGQIIIRDVRDAAGSIVEATVTLE